MHTLIRKVFLKVDLVWVKYGLGFGKEFHKNLRVSCLNFRVLSVGRETGRRVETPHSDFLVDITHLFSPKY